MKLSRQNFYKTYLKCNEEKLYYKDKVRSEILSILEYHSGLSGVQIRRKLLDKGIQIGRDSFYQLINDYRLTLNSRRKAWRKKRYKTPAAKNQIINRTFRRVFEVLVSDYTEIETEEGKLQLLLVEDLVSRFITAYRISPTCSSAPVSEAFQESLVLKSSLGLKYQTIFHSDRGSEFVNHAVRNIARDNNVLISNTGIHRCYENAFMESLNKTLKHSLGLRIRFSSKAEAYTYIEEAINIYNFERQHSKLGNRIPYSVLTSYTGKKGNLSGGKPNFCHPSGRVARTYANSLKVKVKKINIDNHRKHQK
ncbi:MAG: IS3 family transposase [Candidatus Subteraquimicrobiales bacterium]|nr:IS3 family transposase [Candidatus Subteraquimicrobiales bacterium]